MRLREGRIGTQEAVALTAVMLCILGVFALEPGFSYADGNSTFVSVPLSITCSFLFFGFVRTGMVRYASVDLFSYWECSAGKIGASLASCGLLLALFLCAYIPTSRFVTMMNVFVFTDAHYNNIVAYLIPVVGIILFLGGETISRMALFFAPFLVISLVVALVSAIPSYELYRLYPLFGDGVGHIAEVVGSNTTLFLPAMLGLLVLSPAVHGVSRAGRAGLIACGIAVFLCAVTLFVIALVYDYKELTPLQLPLYRINMKVQQEQGLMRLDKLGVFVWMAGSILVSVYAIHISSILYARMFSQEDARPAGAAFAVVLISIIALGQGKAHGIIFESVNFLHRYGYYLFLPLLFLVSAPGVFRKKQEKII